VLLKLSRSGPIRPAEFLPLAEWDEDIDYGEPSPGYIRYPIVWKLMLNRKKVGSVTEKGLVIARK
jgi:hypothetical protein